MEPVRILIVDDSHFIRNILKKILNVPEIEILGTAKNGREGVEKVKELKPDVVTMDVEMPEMNGIEAVKAIMDEHPIPVLMISTLTNDGANATMDALTNGAVDFIAKGNALKDMYELKYQIIKKILSIGGNTNLKNKIIRRQYLRKMQQRKPVLAQKIKASDTSKPSVISSERPAPDHIKIIGIGISTGGPGALQEFITHLSPDMPVPIMIAQHMPPHFTYTLANRLNTLTELTVQEAKSGDKLKPGNIYIAPGGMQMTLRSESDILITDNKPDDELYSPSINVMIDSIVKHYRGRALGIIMTGMGHDGAKAMKKLHDTGGYILSQDIDSCVVSGMPKSIIDLNIANEIHPIEKMAAAVSSIFGLNGVG